jgi:hypothetical protein
LGIEQMLLLEAGNFLFVELTLAAEIVVDLAGAATTRTQAHRGQQ